jgi:gluconokinase
MDQRTCDWDAALLKEVNTSVGALPTISKSTIIDVTLTASFAKRWPSLRNARLCPAVADGAANNIGAGCTTADKLALMIGTSGAARVLYRGEPPSGVPSELWSYRADASRVVIGGALSDGGGLYQWLRQTLLPELSDEEIEIELANTEADSHGLTVLPFWSGERSTGWTLDARGGVYGITRETTPAEIIRAAMEAIAYRFSLIVDAVKSLQSLETIVAAGNALHASHVWLQILSDVLGREILLAKSREASSRGVALLALEAAGKIQNIESQKVSFETVVEPDLANTSRYREAITRQQRLYEAVIGRV